MSSLARRYLFGLSLSSQKTFHNLANDKKTDSEVELLDIPSNKGNRTKNKTLEKAGQIFDLTLFEGGIDKIKNLGSVQTSKT